MECCPRAERMCGWSVRALYEAERAAAVTTSINSSTGKESAVDRDDRTGGVTRRRHTQKRHGAGNVAWLAPAFECGALRDATIVGLILSSRLVDARFDVTRRDRIDSDAFGCPGKRQRLGQHHDAAFAGAVGGKAR
jgi:hypothetical protein